MRNSKLNWTVTFVSPCIKSFHLIRLKKEAKTHFVHKSIPINGSVLLI